MKARPKRIKNNNAGVTPMRNKEEKEKNQSPRFHFDSVIHLLKLNPIEFLLPSILY